MSENAEIEGLSYAEALDELDEILSELESSAVDVDVLAERVARGAVLVKFCRGRLHTVRADVEAVVDGLLDGDGADGADVPGANGAGGG
ncbi:MAG: exodeoxyribonuclease VII small subunit [Actinomycetota bacterium]